MDIYGKYNMKFSWKEVALKHLSENVKVYEYCDKFDNLPIDAAVVELDGQFGPKINKSFTELFFVISGKLIILEDNNEHALIARDVYIMKPGIKHTLHGNNCTLFISCAPQFNPINVDFVS